MARQPFNPIRQRSPGGTVSVGTVVVGEKPELDRHIGECLMLWPPAEAEMALVLGHLLGAKNAAALAVFQTLRRSSSQREAILEAARVLLNQQDRELLGAVLNAHKSIEAERNALCHGHFGTYSHLADGLLWMNTTDYVAVKAAHELAASARFERAEWDKLYANMRVYTKLDLESIRDDIKQLADLWHRFRQYLSERAPRRDELYQQLCDEPRIRRELDNIRHGNTRPI